MSNENMYHHKVTTGEGGDTSGTYSGETIATAQHHSGVYRIEGGVLTHTPFMNSEQITTPAGGIEATAVKQSGFGKADLNDPNTLITIKGVQAPVGMFEAMGMLERGSDGKLSEVPMETKAAPEQTIEENPDERIEPFHEEVEQEVQTFIKAMHPTAYADAVDQAVTAIVNGSGEVDVETLAKLSHKDTDKTHDSLAKVLIANQARAFALMSNEGIPESEHNLAYAWARQEEPQKLQKALTQLIKGRNGNGIRKLAQAYKQDQWLKSYQR